MPEGSRADAPVFFRGPGKLLPGERAKTTAAAAALRRALPAITEEFGGLPALNALISIWLDASLNVLGLAGTEESLRLIRRDLPKMAAAMRAAARLKDGAKPHSDQGEGRA